MGENVVGLLHHIGAQVGYLAQLDPAAQPWLLGIGSGHALVQPLVVHLFEVLRPDVVVEGVPSMHETGEVPETEIEEGQKAQHPHCPEENPAQTQLERGHPQAGETALPPKQDRGQDGENHFPAGAGIAVPVVEIGLGCRGRRRVQDLELRWKGCGRLAVRRDFGNRIGAVALALAHAQETRRHTAHIESAHAQPVAGDRVDLPHHLVVLAVERSPDVVGVVGVGLDGQQAHAHHLAQIPGHGGGAGFEQGGQGRVPHRAFVCHGLVGEQGAIARDLLPRHRQLAGQKIARRTGRHHRGVFSGVGLWLDKGREDQEQAQGKGKARHGWRVYRCLGQDKTCTSNRGTGVRSDCVAQKPIEFSATTCSAAGFGVDARVLAKITSQWLWLSRLRLKK